MKSPILVAVDFSPGNDAVVDEALVLARALATRVVLLHVYDIPMPGFPGEPIPAEFVARIASAARTSLDALAAKHASADASVMTELGQGDPRDVILAKARELGARMIVVGTHGRRGLKRALLGSVAEAVVRSSHVPVLTIRTGGE